MGELSPKLLRFWALHLAWAVLALVASLVLATSEGGHPPAIIFLPVVLVAWILGHAFLALIHHAVRRQATRRGAARATRWPIPITGLLVLAAGSLFSTVNALGWSLLVRGEEMSWQQILLAGSVVVAPGVVVVSILLRRDWGRIVAAIAPAAFFVYLTIRVLSAAAYWSQIGAGEWLGAAALFLASGGLAYYLLKSQSAAEFFRGERAPGA